MEQNVFAILDNILDINIKYKNLSIFTKKNHRKFLAIQNHVSIHKSVLLLITQKKDCSMLVV